MKKLYSVAWICQKFDEARYIFLLIEDDKLEKNTNKSG